MAHAVKPFVVVARATLAVAAHDLGVDPEDVVWSLHRSVRQGGEPHEGMTASGIEYSVHGIGCRFVTPDGSMVDLDIDGDARPIFNPWRVRLWVRSAGGPEPDDESIRDEAAELVRQGELSVVRGDWWTWVLQPARMTLPYAE
jgi:hypothetical protein